MTVDLDTAIIKRALERAGVRLYKTENNAANLGIHAERALATALKDEIALAYESERARYLACTVDPRVVITPKDKGPRPYSVSTREGPLMRRAINAVLDRHPHFIGMDFGFEEKSETGNEHYSDCAVHSAPASAPGPCDCGIEAKAPPKPEPCPHEVMDDDGGPVRKDWDDHPKVGLEGYEAREAQRKAEAARIAVVMGWKD